MLVAPPPVLPNDNAYLIFLFLFPLSSSSLSNLAAGMDNVLSWDNWGHAMTAYSVSESTLSLCVCLCILLSLSWAAALCQILSIHLGLPINHTIYLCDAICNSCQSSSSLLNKIQSRELPCVIWVRIKQIDTKWVFPALWPRKYHHSGKWHGLERVVFFKGGKVEDWCGCEYIHTYMCVCVETSSLWPLICGNIALKFHPMSWKEWIV